MIPDERGIGLEAIELVAKVRRYSLREGRFNRCHSADIGQLHGYAVLVAGILDLRVGADVEKIVRPKAVYTAGVTREYMPNVPALPKQIAPVRLDRDPQWGATFDSASVVELPVLKACSTGPEVPCRL